MISYDKKLLFFSSVLIVIMSFLFFYTLQIYNIDGFENLNLVGFLSFMTLSFMCYDKDMSYSSSAIYGILISFLCFSIDSFVFTLLSLAITYVMKNLKYFFFFLVILAFKMFTNEFIEESQVVYLTCFSLIFLNIVEKERSGIVTAIMSLYFIKFFNYTEYSNYLVLQLFVIVSVIMFQLSELKIMRPRLLNASVLLNGINPIVMITIFLLDKVESLNSLAISRVMTAIFILVFVYYSENAYALELLVLSFLFVIIKVKGVRNVE